MFSVWETFMEKVDEEETLLVSHLCHGVVVVVTVVVDVRH